MAVIPPRPELDHPTGQGHRDLLVALADGRCLELSYPLLEIRAAVATEIRGFRWMGSQGKHARVQPERSCDGEGMFLSVPQTSVSPDRMPNRVARLLAVLAVQPRYLPSKIPFVRRRDFCATNIRRGEERASAEASALEVSGKGQCDADNMDETDISLDGKTPANTIPKIGFPLQ